MARISYVNGEFVEHAHARVSVDDRGYQFSDGVYEVILIKSVTPIDWQLHMERLRRSLAGLRITYTVDEALLRGIIKSLCAKNHLANASIYLQISRGVAPRDHAFPATQVAPFVVMTISPYTKADAVYVEGASAITLPDLRWKRRDYKTISLLPNILAKQQAVEAGAIEAILFEEDDVVTEASASNVFMVDTKGVLKTHPANNFILGGITRLGVIEVAKEQSIAVEETCFSKDDLMRAAEIFITSTTKHVLPIIAVDGHNIGDGKVGEVTRKLIKAYAVYVDRQIDA
jgi:D-alanine transaminase